MIAQHNLQNNGSPTVTNQISWSVSTPTLSFAANSVFSVLERHSGLNHVIQGMGCLVNESGYSTSTVRRALRELERKQYIRKTFCSNPMGGSLPNCYELLWKRQ